jgi:hypothetical protein
VVGGTSVVVVVSPGDVALVVFSVVSGAGVVAGTTEVQRKAFETLPNAKVISQVCTFIVKI